MQNTPQNSASFGAQVSVNPKLSQAVLVVLLLVSLIPLSAGIYFLWHEKSGAWIPLLIGITIVLLVYVGWLKSYKMIDMADAPPTRLLDKDGNEVITDSRTLSSPLAIESLAQLLQSMAGRQPLPQPDGIVGNDGTVLEDSAESAAEIANNINQEIQKNSDDFMRGMTRGNSESSDTAEQLSSDNFENVLEHNKAELEN